MMFTLLIALGASSMLWPAPPLTKPTTIRLGSGPTVSRLNPDQDYILKLPDTRKLGSTVILGGRNISIIGGHISVPRSDRQRRALYIKGATGTVHLEGILVDNPDKAEFDAIAIAAPQAVVQIERVRVEGLTGSQATFHSDVIQPWGGVKELRVDQLTATSSYQGIQLPDMHGGSQTGRVFISRTNLIYADQAGFTMAAAEDRAKGGFLLWTILGRSCEKNTKIILKDVFVQQSATRRAVNAVWPPADGSTKCGTELSRDGTTITFPKLPVQGQVKIGRPSAGDFVPAGTVGLKYRSNRR